MAPSTIAISFETALLLLGVCLAVYAIELLFFWSKNRRQLHQQQLLLQEQSRLRNDVELLGLRLAAQEAQLRLISASSDHVAADDAEISGRSPYAQAIRLVHEGAGVEEIQRNCGLARGEAELIVALYRSEGKT
ncbi:DUF2802 domain-containing protein [Chitinilyticum aquatile]|uniref:DUF2802 domain-containing protein n=1 Tax=Chitinilyticum aquatile TaxID=362520 RepID=UPI00048F4129|nr:DUF2802 domain-containing protein [Chitinilyticum aquatile]